MTLAAAATWILVLVWPTGEITRENATTFATCEAAARAATAGIGLPLSRVRPATSGHCERPGAGEGFPAGWDCIATSHPTADYHCRG